VLWYLLLREAVDCQTGALVGTRIIPTRNWPREDEAPAADMETGWIRTRKSMRKALIKNESRYRGVAYSQGRRGGRTRYKGASSLSDSTDQENYILRDSANRLPARSVTQLPPLSIVILVSTLLYLDLSNNMSSNNNNNDTNRGPHGQGRGGGARGSNRGSASGPGTGSGPGPSLGPAVVTNPTAASLSTGTPEPIGTPFTDLGTDPLGKVDQAYLDNPAFTQPQDRAMRPEGGTVDLSDESGRQSTASNNRKRNAKKPVKAESTDQENDNMTMPELLQALIKTIMTGHDNTLEVMKDMVPQVVAAALSGGPAAHPDGMDTGRIARSTLHMPRPGEAIPIFNGYEVSSFLEDFNHQADICNINKKHRPALVLRYVHPTVAPTVRRCIIHDDWDATVVEIKREWASQDERQLQTPQQRLFDLYNTKVGKKAENVKAWLGAHDIVLREANITEPQMDEVWKTLPSKLTSHICWFKGRTANDIKQMGYAKLKELISDLTESQTQMERKAHLKGESLDFSLCPFEDGKTGDRIDKLKQGHSPSADQANGKVQPDTAAEQTIGATNLDGIDQTTQALVQRSAGTAIAGTSQQNKNGLIKVAPKQILQRTATEENATAIADLTRRLNDLQIHLTQSLQQPTTTIAPYVRMPLRMSANTGDTFVPSINQNVFEDDPQVNMVTQVGRLWDPYKNQGRSWLQRRGSNAGDRSYQLKCWYCHEDGHSCPECQILTQDLKDGLGYWDLNQDLFYLGNPDDKDTLVLPRETMKQAKDGWGMRALIKGMGEADQNLPIAKAMRQLQLRNPNSSFLSVVSAPPYFVENHLDLTKRTNAYNARRKEIFGSTPITAPQPARVEEIKKDSVGEQISSINTVRLVDDDGQFYYSYPDGSLYNDYPSGINNILLDALEEPRIDHDTGNSITSALEGQEESTLNMVQTRKRARIENDDAEDEAATAPLTQPSVDQLLQQQLEDTAPESTLPATALRNPSSEASKKSATRVKEMTPEELRLDAVRRITEMLYNGTIKVSMRDLANLNSKIATGMAERLHDVADGVTRVHSINEEGGSGPAPRRDTAVRLNEIATRDDCPRLVNTGNASNINLAVLGGSEWRVNNQLGIRRLAFLNCRIGPVGNEEVIKGCLDSGAEANIISNLYVKRNGLAMTANPSTSRAYGGGRVDFLGTITEQIWVGSASISVTFYVADSRVARQDLLLGLPFFAATRLNFNYDSDGSPKEASMIFGSLRIIAGLLGEVEMPRSTLSEN